MGDLYLVRHGEQVRPGDDPQLTPAGVAQARSLVGRLPADVAVRCSPVRRARETLQHAGFDLGLATIDDRLIEHETYPHDFPSRMMFPGAHWDLHAADRASLFAKDCLAFAPITICCAHWNIISRIIGGLLGVGCDNKVLFGSDHCGVSLLRWDGKWRLEFGNRIYY